MSHEDDDEAALRAKLNPRTSLPNPRLSSVQVCFHPTDWRAFMVGLEKTFGVEPSLAGYDYDKNLYVFRSREVNKISQMKTDAGEHLEVYSPINIMLSGRDYINDLASLEGEIWNAVRYPIVNIMLTSFDQWSTGITATPIFTHGYKDDPEKTAFQKKVKSLPRRMSPKAMLVADRKTGKVTNPEWRASGRYGHAAIRWLMEDPERRRLDGGAYPMPDWTFPEDHPWYQFDD